MMLKTFQKIALLGLFVSMAPTAYGAKVRKITKKIVVVGGIVSSDEFEKGMRVCFFDKNEEEIGCGKIAKVSSSGKIMFVRVKRAIKKKLRKGYTVRAEGADASSIADASEDSSGKSTSSKPLKIWTLFTPAVRTPAVYNKLAYKAMEDPENPETLWDQGDVAGTAVADAIVGFSLAVGIPVGNISIIPGFRYRLYRSTLVAADQFVDTSPNLFVETEQTATAIAFFTDVGYLNVKLGSSVDFFLTTGLDFDMSTVTLKATIKDDGPTPVADNEMASATSSLTLVGLRLGTGLDIMFAKAFGMNLGLNLIIPVAEASNSFSADINDPELAGPLDQEEDLKTALGHTKGGVGIDLNLGFVLAF